MNYIITFFIVLLLVVIFILSFLLFKEKFDTEIPLYTGATESSDKSDDFLPTMGITDPTSQILITNSNGDLSLLSLLTLKKGIDKVSQDGIRNNNLNELPNIYTKTVDLPNTYTTTDDLKQNYIKKGKYYSLSNQKAGDRRVHYDTGDDPYLKADGDECQYTPSSVHNFKFDEPCPDKP
jgi:hypothetical protein